MESKRLFYSTGNLPTQYSPQQKGLTAKKKVEDYIGGTLNVMCAEMLVRKCSGYKCAKLILNGVVKEAIKLLELPNRLLHL